MNKERLNTLIENTDHHTCKIVLSILLSAHAFPVFGAAKSIEHEVAAFHALQKINYISENPDDFELVMKLRVTKAKARSLLYQVALRRNHNADDTNDALRSLLTQPRVMKEGDKVLIEVVDPLLMDSLRQRIRELNYISDGSFSGSIAKISVEALSALVVNLIHQDQRQDIERKLRDKGIRGDNLTSLIGNALAHYGMHVAGNAGSKLGEKIGDKLGDFLIDGSRSLYQWVSPEKRN